MHIVSSVWDYVPTRFFLLQATWTHKGRRIEFERRRSRGLRSTRSLNRDVSGKKAATNRKKYGLFPRLIRQTHLCLLFQEHGSRRRGPMRKKRIFRRLIKQTVKAKIPCSALNAPQFKCSDTTLNEIACIKCNAVSAFTWRPLIC